MLLNVMWGFAELSYILSGDLVGIPLEFEHHIILFQDQL